ncbi:MAG: hydrogenase maturation protease [Candidatus Thiodiazotropha lotti]|nr:hydrogenase maturation protease [Candidatus Thiodiazotropha lotti]MCG8006052.1 hydrogenase maturation protease [Candidatus Thiodiazotropha lotti]MCG8021101.1 hydrogenase maturation protease [Candidatus Thiodiazotropha lotti]MCW4193632.1 hydrogenase maturation protease [Candidatus Thiodiazotropha lotti]MCW4205679.1 hydrogenase maturation protease [Candidatus Thiodiazotropha lotti]
MIRIIGVGSPFGADRVGWLAIDHLQGCQLEDCELIKLDRPGSGLLNYLRDADWVVLIDALKSTGRAGDVAQISRDKLAQCQALTSCHGFGVAEALALADQLGELPRQVLLLGIHVGDDQERPPALDVVSLEQQIQALLASG